MYKQLIVIRRDLNISIGKACAQASHASMAFLTKMIIDHVVGEVFQGSGDGQTFMNPTNVYRVEGFDIDKDLYEQWIQGIFTKVVCGAKNKNQLMKAVKIAEEMGMKEGEDFYIIKDCCLTELEPEEFDENGVGRTITCIGFVPMEAEKIEKISRKFQLLK